MQVLQLYYFIYYPLYGFYNFSVIYVFTAYANQDGLTLVKGYELENLVEINSDLR